MRLRAGAATDTGRVRDINEDAFGSTPEQAGFVVCDGMGGAAAGEVASRIAVETILDALGAGTAIGDPDDADPGYLPRTARLGAAVRRANDAIWRQAQSDARQAGMGTTVVAAWIDGHIASVVHVGDSRAYLWHEGRLEPLTSDHSLVEQQVQAGLLDRETSLQSEHQNILLRALGRSPDIEVDLAEVPVRPGDVLLLCTDGLTRMVAEPAMAQVISALRDPQRICDRLIAAANENGGVDNVTVVVVDMMGGRWGQVWSRFTRAIP